MAAQTRSQVIKTYHYSLPKAEADLLSGIVLGKQSLTRGFKARLASVGLSHVVAASGMNVSFFSAAALGLLTVFRWSKLVKYLVALVFILFYATMTGFDPPIIRACLMAAFAGLATLTGRTAGAVLGLLISAYVMLWAAPDLVTNPGFLLSFTAMTGQIFAGTIRVSLPKLLEAVTVVFLQSLAALVATFPIVLIFFSNFSLVAIFTNVMVLWTIEPLMILGSIIGVLGFFFMPVTRLLAVPAQGLLDFFLWVVNTFGSSGLSNRLQLHVNFANNLNAILFAAAYYLLLGYLIRLWQIHKNRPRFSTSNREVGMFK